MTALFRTFKPGYNSLDWEFTDPDTGYQFRTGSRADLVKQIITYRINNQLEPIDNLDLVLNDYLCKLPCNAGNCRINGTLSRGLIGTVKGGVTLLKSMAFKAFVSQEKADDRSSVCARCPMNVFPDKKAFVKYSDRVALHCIGKRRTSNFDNLGNCAVCSCVLKAKVWIVPENLSATEEEMKEFPSFCWVKKELNGVANE